MTNEALLFQILTLSEASAWWGKSKTAIQMKLLRQEAIQQRVFLRKSGNTYLVNSSDLLAIYGAPKNERPS